MKRKGIPKLLFVKRQGKWTKSNLLSFASKFRRFNDHQVTGKIAIENRETMKTLKVIKMKSQVQVTLLV